MKSLKVTVAVLALGLALAGCSSLPSSGPLTDDVVKNGDNDVERRYVVVDIDERATAIINSHPGPSLRARFGDYRPAPDLRLGVGDEVRVLIFEAAAGGLFSTPVTSGMQPGSRSALIPDQVVQRDGTITVPYAGRIDVRGKLPSDVEEIVLQRLSGKAIEPQAIVTVSRSVSNTVVVTGEVTNGARVPLTPRGDRVMDVIGTVGGVRGTVHDTFVRLTRGNATATVPMENILSNPQENVYMRPGDILTLVREPLTFTAYGATNVNQVVPFNRIGLSLEEAVARAGGLNDLRSDPDGVFLLRFEPASLVHELVPDRPTDRREQLVPVVYRLGLRDAKSFFLARSFSMRDKDIVYVSNATAVELGKFLALIGAITGPISSGLSSAYYVK